MGNENGQLKGIIVNEDAYKDYMLSQDEDLPDLMLRIKYNFQKVDTNMDKPVEKK
jgi:hypothetical protein